MKHVLRVIRELLAHEPRSRGTDVAEALRFLARVQRRRATAFLVSDFISADFEKDLSAVRAKHDIIAVRTSDRREVELPSAGLLTLEDAETGEVIVVDSRSARVRRLFESRTQEDRSRQDSLLRSLKVDELEITTGKSYVDELSRFFRLREKKMYR